MPRWPSPGRLWWEVALEEGPWWRERQLGDTLLRAALTVARGLGGGGLGALRNLPGPAAPEKPPEAPPTPVPRFPLSKCGQQLACLPRGNGCICQSSLEIKAQVTSREWLLLMQRRVRARLRSLRGSLIGKGGDPEATARIINPHGGERVGADSAAGTFLPSPRPESALRRGAGTRSLWPTLG